MILTRITAPTALPVSLADARERLRIDHTTEDGVLQGMIEAATGYFDGAAGVLGRAIMPQTWRLEVAGWSDVIRLPIGPASAVAIAYDDAAGTPQTLTGRYRLIGDGVTPYLQRIDDGAMPALASTRYPVRIDISAGETPAPPAIATQILLMVGDLYNQRAGHAERAVSAMPAVHALMTQTRRHGF